MCDLLQVAAADFHCGNDLNFGRSWGLIVVLDPDDSSEAVASVKCSDKIVNFVEVVKVMSDIRVDWEFSKHDFVHELGNILS